MFPRQELDGFSSAGRDRACIVGTSPDDGRDGHNSTAAAHVGWLSCWARSRGVACLATLNMYHAWPEAAALQLHT
jgi:hypothetical protein